MSRPGSEGVTLGEAIGSLTIEEVVWKPDFFLGVLGGLAGGWAASTRFELLSSWTAGAATIVGTVLGVAIAAIAVISALMSDSLMRKIRLIGRDPIRYVQPLLFTSLLGVFAAAFNLTSLLLKNTDPGWLRVGIGALAMGLTSWTLASVPLGLSAIVGFTRLKEIASEVDDG